MKYTHIIFAIDETASAVEMYAAVNEYLRERGEYSEYQEMGGRLVAALMMMVNATTYSFAAWRILMF